MSCPVLSHPVSCPVHCPLSCLKSPVLSPLSCLQSCPLSCPLCCPRSCPLPCPLSPVPRSLSPVHCSLSSVPCPLSPVCTRHRYHDRDNDINITRGSRHRHGWTTSLKSRGGQQQPLLPHINPTRALRLKGRYANIYR